MSNTDRIMLKIRGSSVATADEFDDYESDASMGSTASETSLTGITSNNIIQAPSGRRRSQRTRRKPSNIYTDKHWGKVMKGMKKKLLRGVDLQDLKIPDKEFQEGLKQQRRNGPKFTKTRVAIRSIETVPRKVDGSQSVDSAVDEVRWCWLATGENARLCEEGMEASYRTFTFKILAVHEEEVEVEPARMLEMMRVTTPCTNTKLDVSTVKKIKCHRDGREKDVHVRVHAAEKVMNEEDCEEWVWTLHFKTPQEACQMGDVFIFRKESVVVESIEVVEEMVEAETEEMIKVYTAPLNTSLSLSTIKTMSLHMEIEDCEEDLEASEEEDDDLAEFFVTQARVMSCRSVTDGTWEWRVDTDDSEIFIIGDVVVVEQYAQLADMTLTVQFLLPVGAASGLSLRTEAGTAEQLNELQQLLNNGQNVVLKRQPRREVMVDVECQNDEGVIEDDAVSVHSTVSKGDAAFRDDPTDPDFYLADHDVDEVDEVDDDNVSIDGGGSNKSNKVKKVKKEKSVTKQKKSSSVKKSKDVNHSSKRRRHHKRKRHRHHKKRHRHKKHSRRHKLHRSSHTSETFSSDEECGRVLNTKTKKKARRSKKKVKGHGLHHVEPVQGAICISSSDDEHARRPVKRARTKPVEVRDVQMILEDIEETEQEMKCTKSEAQRKNAQAELEQLRANLHKTPNRLILWTEWTNEQAKIAKREGNEESLKECKHWQACLKKHAYADGEE